MRRVQLHRARGASAQSMGGQAMGRTSKDDDDGAKARRTAEEFAGNVRDSAQQIWLAGLGAFAKAQQEGGKVFESLVKEGMTMQRRTQAAAEEKFAEATNRMASVASEISAKATGQWDKLEGIFEERVSRAMKRLGVPTSADMDTLTSRIDALAARIDALDHKLSRGHGIKAANPRAAAPGARSTAAKAPGAKASARARGTGRKTG
jgi:poly(hydroxyalkanoate) granule-associated protein